MVNTVIVRKYQDEKDSITFKRTMKYSDFVLNKFIMYIN